MSLSFLGFGSPIVDYNAVVTEDFIRRHLPGEKGGTVHINSAERRKLMAALPSSRIRSCGGSAGNTVYALLKLGISAALFGKLADDEDGVFFQHEMAEAGGQTRFLLHSPTGNTGCCLCFVTPDAERTMCSDLGVSREISGQEATPEFFRDRPVFHTEGYMRKVPGFFSVVRQAKEAGCRISFDLSSKELAAENRPALTAFLKEFVSILFLNREEAAALTGKTEPEQMMEILGELCPVVHLKLGASGVLIKTPEEREESLSASPVTAIDTTAAGDYYTAGYFQGIFNGKSEWDSARDGVSLASEIVQVPGSRLPEERWQIIRKQLQQEKR